MIGPIANDTIFETYGIITSGYLTPKDALRLLMIGPEYTQVAIKTEKAATQLVWTGAETVNVQDGDSKQLRKEKEEYELLFSEAAEDILEKTEMET